MRKETLFILINTTHECRMNCKLDTADFEHFTVNYKHSFVDSESSCHTQTIERL